MAAQDTNPTFVESIRLRNAAGTIDVPVCYFDSADNLILGGAMIVEGNFADGIASNPSIAFGLDTDTGIYRGGSGIVAIASNGVGSHFFSASAYNLRSDSAILTFGALDDVPLTRDAAGVLALKNSTNAQAFRVYGTTTGTKYASLSHDGTNAIISASSGVVKFGTSFGYATGVGGTIAQGTNKATTVVLSKACGQITTDAANLAAATIVSFTLTNTLIAAGDVLVLNHVSGGTVGSYTLNAQCGAGAATINIRNNTAGGLAEALVIGFVLIKGVTA